MSSGYWRTSAKEKEAFKTCKDKIQEHGLPMKLIDVEYTFDNSKIIFYFTAEGRVDFRELVKNLAAIFRTRIELRQIGVRDEAKMVGESGAAAGCCAAVRSWEILSRSRFGWLRTRTFHSTQLRFRESAAV